MERVPGPHLREQRKLRGLTLQQLGSKVGLSHSTLSRIENSVEIDPSYLASLDAAFGSTDWRTKHTPETHDTSLDERMRHVEQMVGKMLGLVEKACHEKHHHKRK